jgi:uncharacterized protein (TIGR02246 family)
MESDEREIRDLVAIWTAATKAGDLDRVLSLMADDVVFLVPGRDPIIGKAAFAAASQAQAGAAALQFEGTSEILEIQVMGDWAFMWTKLKVVITPPGGALPMTRAGHTLCVLEKQNGKWVMARDANLLAPVKEAEV